MNSKNKIVKHSVKLGELLLLSGAITEIDLINGLELSLMQDKSIGQIFVQSKLLSESVLKVAMELQQSVNSSAISAVTAVETLNFICKSNDQQSDLVLESRLEPTIALTDILLQANLVEENDLAYAAQLSLSFPALLGKLLVIGGVIDEATLMSALRCQLLIDEWQLSAADGVDVLKHASLHQMTFEDAMIDLNVEL